jgi:hypothetical protein
MAWDRDKHFAGLNRMEWNPNSPLLIIGSPAVIDI